VPIAAVNGTELYYEVSGEGEPIVLLPGLGMGTAYFDLAAPLFAQSAKAVALDPRGIARSAKPAEPYSAETWADDVAALLDHLGEGPAHIVGCSLGGCVAMALVDRHPDKVASLALVAAFSELDFALELNWRLRMDIVEATGMTGPIRDHVTLWTLGRAFLETEQGRAVAERIRSGVGDNDPAQYQRFLRAILDFGRVTPETRDLPTYTERLRDVHVPTLFIAGADDILTPPVHSHRAAAAMPEGVAEVVVIPDCGHITMVEAPEENVRLVIEFVQRVTAGSEVQA